MESVNKNKSLIISFLMFIIIILITLTIILIMNNIKLNENIKEINNETEKLNEWEAILILKANYNDAVRHIFNEGVSYCGLTDFGTNLSLNGFSYSKSVTYNTFEELREYLKQYMSDELLVTSRFDYTYDMDGVVISSYIEKDGNLYCNGWNKGSNLLLVHYSEVETNFKITNIEDDSFDAIINAVYHSVDKNYRTVLKIKVSVIKQNDKWVLDTYEQLN